MQIEELARLLHVATKIESIHKLYIHISHAIPFQISPISTHRNIANYSKPLNYSKLFLKLQLQNFKIELSFKPRKRIIKQIQDKTVVLICV